MSKTTNQQRLRVFKTWVDANIAVKPKKKKQPDWLKDELDENEKSSSK